MTQFIAKIIVIALLFVSAEAAICSTFHLLDSDELVHIDDDNAHNELFEENSCNHMCHCAHHFATFSTDTSLIPNNSDQEVSHYSDHYSSNDSPPLFRPPIA